MYLFIYLFIGLPSGDSAGRGGALGVRGLRKKGQMGSTVIVIIVIVMVILILPVVVLIVLIVIVILNMKVIVIQLDFGRGRMWLALIGPLLLVVLFDRGTLGTKLSKSVNICQHLSISVPFSPIRQNSLFLAAAPLVLTPLLRSQVALMVDACATEARSHPVADPTSAQP